MRALFFLGWLLLVLFLVWPLVRRFRRPARPFDSAGGSRALRDELVKDPVCQTYVLRSRAVTREVGGGTHYFCSRECAARFPAIRSGG